MNVDASVTTSGLADLDTPALVLDRARLAANTARMVMQARRHNVRLRPHVKTIKSVEALRFALPDVDAITVSTLREAEYFGAAGYRDILYGVGLTPGKIPRIAALRARGLDVHAVVDNRDAAAAFAHASAPAAGFSAYIEIDTGAGRGGVSPDSEELTAIAHLLKEGRVALRGVMTHAGHSYACADAQGITGVAESERSGAVRAAERLRAAGFSAPEVSVGSTPTVVHGASFDGVTEIRPGVFFTMDLFQSQLGVCAIDDLALSVVASVIRWRPQERKFLVDAGALALSQDRSTARQSNDTGYGLVGGMAGPPWPGACVTTVYQEHGVVSVPPAIRPSDVPVGSKVRIWPNHACMTAAAYTQYHVTDGGEVVVAQWPRVNHW
jgi:D-serine deaminase-like pyridoxal phosphate-dependent protein